MSVRPPPARPTLDVSAPSADPLRVTTRGPDAAPVVVAGRYEILGLLGSGGMGSVYRARDRELDEIVALKTLHRTQASSETALERFRREVKLARRVTHRNVARSFDLGEHEGEKFLTMEYVEGPSLGAFLQKEKTAPPSRLFALMRQVCEGLAAAHAAGVVHRDLKPENILVGAGDRIVLMDFGIARALLEEGELLRTAGGPVGTPAYMAPEQLEGAQDIDARADIYAMGVILFEIFTGQPPWKGQSIYSVASSRLLEPPQDPSRVRPDLPAALSALILKCMARDRNHRFATATELGDALQASSQDAALFTMVSVSATKTSTPRPTASTGRGIRTVAVLPFLPGSDEDAYLADALTEELIDQLSMTPNLRVRPRGVVVQMIAPDRDPPELGAKLKVDVVVDGSLRRSGAGLRVNARIIAVADGFQLWARRFTQPIEDVLAVSDEVARAVASALSVEPEAPASRRMPTSPAALDLFLRARHEYHKLDSASMLRSVDLYEQALEIAPEEPSILIGSALAKVRHWYFGGVGTGERARSAAERAVAAAPDRGEARLALAAVKLHENDVVGATREARKSLLLSPALADAHELLGRILAETGPHQLGLSHLISASRLDPLLYQAKWSAARVYALLGRWEEAETLIQETIDGRAMPGGWLYMARVLLWKRDESRAKAILASGAVDGAEHDVARRLLTLAAGGEDIDLARLFDPSLGSAHASGRSFVFRHQIRAELLGLQGKLEEARGSLEQSVAGGLVDLLWMDLCPLLEALRSQGWFAELRGPVVARAEAVEVVLRETVLDLLV